MDIISPTLHYTVLTQHVISSGDRIELEEKYATFYKEPVLLHSQAASLK